MNLVGFECDHFCKKETARLEIWKVENFLLLFQTREVQKVLLLIGKFFIVIYTVAGGKNVY